MPLVCVFNVNETLLDLGALDPLFGEAFGDGQVRELWFKQVLNASLVLTLTEHYREFSEICDAALEEVAQKRGVSLEDRQRKGILEELSRLPLHGDVKGALQILRGAGVRIAALTNSSARRAQEPLRRAGVLDYFERIFSTDSVKRFKPAPEPYWFAAKHLGVPVQKIRMIAAHPWDLAGAMNVGARGALVKRRGIEMSRLYPEPEIQGGDLLEVAQLVLRRDRRDLSETVA